MIQHITLQSVLPDVFLGRALCGDIWQQTCCFQRSKSYLIEAASGTGKSSLCSFIYGERTDYQGTISFDERDIRSFTRPERSRLWQTELGVLFQDLRLFGSLTAYENVWLNNQLTHYRSEAWIVQLFERLGIADKQHERLSTLSWGQQQRVAFARMLCQPASFLLMDEPVSHLDDSNASTMAEILREEQQQSGVGLLLTSVGKHLPLSYDAVYRL